MASHSSDGGFWLDRALGAAAALLLFSLMLLTTVDVTGRYLFSWHRCEGQDNAPPLGTRAIV